MSDSKKPVEADLFQDQLKPNQAKPEAAPKEAPAAVPSDSKEAKAESKEVPTFPAYIVVVDDSATNTTVICGILKNLGVGSHAFKSAPEALEFLRSCGEEEMKKIIAIFSDLEMPKMDGLEFLETVRGTDRLKTMPFMMITASKEREIIQKAAQLGVHGYLLKPITQNQILTRLTSLQPTTALKLKKPA